MSHKRFYQREMKKHLTIKDVAELAQVSPSAVSIALNNRKGISGETREKILKIVNDIQYVPNQQARRLLLKYTNNIGILHEKTQSPLSHLFLVEIMNQVISSCEDLGYNAIFTRFSTENGPELPEIVKNSDVDGIIILGEAGDQVIRAIKEYDIPLVLVDAHRRAEHVVSIEADYLTGAEMAMRYLIACGHRRIAYIGENHTGKYGQQTLAGYRSAIEKARLDIPFSYFRGEAELSTEESGFICMNRILDSEQVPTAVFCAADIYAIGAMRAAKKRGLRIPEDISFIGMDNILLSEFVEPRLTTIKFAKDAMGEKAVDILASIIRGKTTHPRQVIFQGELIERDSVRRPK